MPKAYGLEHNTLADSSLLKNFNLTKASVISFQTNLG